MTIKQENKKILSLTYTKKEFVSDQPDLLYISFKPFSIQLLVSFLLSQCCQQRMRLRGFRWSQTNHHQSKKLTFAKKISSTIYDCLAKISLVKRLAVGVTAKPPSAVSRNIAGI